MFKIVTGERFVFKSQEFYNFFSVCSQKHRRMFKFHIWSIARFRLNLPRDDCHFFLHLSIDDHHFGYKQKFLKKDTGTS
jgi:hypothetical protein